MTLGLLALGSALAATLGGADRYRRSFHPVERARAGLSRLLDRGPDDPEVRATLLALRRQLARQPLDARTRVLYAGLLLELAGNLDEARAAAFHASRAATLAPVTVPVVRAAATVLARCGEQEEALTRVREMFGYEPESAAHLLISLEPFLPPEALSRGAPEGAIPFQPASWLAWSRELRSRGRTDESEEWTEEAHQRWPDHLPVRRALAALAVGRQDWERLAEILPTQGKLPEEPSAAVLFAYRARLRAETGSADEARADAEKAASLARNDPSILLLVGDALLASRDPDRARHTWNRALFALPGGDGHRPIRVLLGVRLARLEDAHGMPADALRAWKAVLEEDPEHTESRRRVDDLTGFHH